MNDVIPPKIYDLLNNVVNRNIEDYYISVHDPNKKGEGFLGRMSYISLKEKNDGTTRYFIVKQAFADEKLRELQPIREYYLSEINFYTKVWPAFRKFQSDRLLSEPFDKIPKCFITSSEFEHEMLVFENLKHQAFQTYTKKEPLDENHLSVILKQYGKFHAISFAYKLLRPEEFEETTKDIDNLFAAVSKLQFFRDYIKYIYEITLNSLDPQKDAKVIEKFKPYLETIAEKFHDKFHYGGKHSVVLHGDCWSNNMMFKYNESKKVCDIRLFDFQFSYIGTPVHDLSYCLYSGGSRETFKNLDHYLRLYHNSLLERLEDFGLNSSNIYPFEALKRDWKEYCLSGLSMALMVWRMKLVYDDDVKDLTDMTDDGDFNMFSETKYDVDVFNCRVRDLILHVFENEFL